MEELSTQQEELELDEEFAAGWKAFRRELEEIGENRGKAIGEARGKAIGEARAMVRLRGELLLRLLTQRGFVVDANTRARILACADVEQLDMWLDSILIVRSPAELFAKTSSRDSR